MVMDLICRPKSGKEGTMPRTSIRVLRPLPGYTLFALQEWLVPGRVLLACLLVGCGRERSTEPVSETWLSMGTTVSLSVPAAEAAELPAAVAACKTVLVELERQLSSFDCTSEVARISAAAGSAPLVVSPATREVVGHAVHFAEVSEGGFDPTVWPLMRLWGFYGGRRPAHCPASDTIAATLKQVGYQHIVLGTNTVGLDRPGMELDLGGIAKGYAVDGCYVRLTTQGRKHFLLNLGGNIRCCGMADGRLRPWTIGVRNPLQADAIIGQLRLPSGMAVATSGNYERFVVIDGRRYSHIMDPRSGQPVEGMAGVTVVSPTATEADGMSTALFVAGLAGSPAILARVPTTRALLVPDRQPLEIWMTPACGAVFTPVEGVVCHMLR